MSVTFEEGDLVAVKETGRRGVVTWITGNRITVRMDDNQDNEYYSPEQIKLDYTSYF